MKSVATLAALAIALSVILGGCVRMGHGIFGDCADCEPVDPALAAAAGVLLHMPPAVPVYTPTPIGPAVPSTNIYIGR